MPDIVEDPLLRNKRKKMIYINSYTGGSGAAPTDYIAYYPLNGDANDASGNGNNGIVNGATFSAGEGKDGAYVFDGINDRINIDSVVNDVSGSTTGTFSVWIKPTDATPETQGEILAFGDTNADEYLIFRFLQPLGTLDITARNSGTFDFAVRTDSSITSDNTWTHVAVVQNGIFPVLYVNAVVVPQTFAVSTDLTSWVYKLIGIDNGRIGGLNWNNNGEVLFFNGTIDEVQIFGRALSESEILQIYNASKSFFGL